MAQADPLPFSDDQGALLTFLSILLERIRHLHYTLPFISYVVDGHRSLLLLYALLKMK